MRHLALLLAFGLAACGGGGRNEIEPPIIIQTATLLNPIQIDTFPTIEGTKLHDEGLGPGPFETCGRIKSIGAYRTDTELVFRIEDGLGFCWDLDIYFLGIRNVTWRGVPGTTIILLNEGDPLEPGNDHGSVVLLRNSTLYPENGITVRQWRDDPADGFFYLAIPLDLFRFFTDPNDAKSVFEVSAEIQRRTNGALVIRDWTAAVNVDFVDPQ